MAAYAAEVGAPEPDAVLTASQAAQVLSPFLRHAQSDVRSQAIGQLAKYAADDAIWSLLVDHYRRLCATEGDVAAIGAERREVLRAIALRDHAQALPFVREALDLELGVAARAHRARLPLSEAPITSLSGLILASYPSDPVLTQRIGEALGDEELSLSVRRRLAALVARMGLLRAGVTALDEQVIRLAAELEPRPVAPVPWAVYRDQGKRVAYMGSPDYVARLEEAGAFLRSRRGITQAGIEQALQDLGLDAVALVTRIACEQPDDLAKRCALLEVAARTLLEHTKDGPGLGESAHALLIRLRREAEALPDDGAYGRRASLSGVLNTLAARLPPSGEGHGPR